MKCHYEVLEIDRDADDATIKVAYRKLALRWHPDKNLDNGEEAKTRFQLIQQAYEVLSDAQERAWYDRHREQILRGSESYSDESLDVFQYFTASCYRGYNDSKTGFYSVYCEVFEKLSAEDLEFMDSDDEMIIPGFGNSSSSYEEVVGPFYAFWQSYCTKKSFAWLCPHNVTEIRDRRILRHVEKDTKKLASKARKDRNDEVRALVAFVKKRDRRVLEYRRMLEERAEINRSKQQLKRLDQLRKNREEVEEAMRLQKENGLGGSTQVDYEKQLRQMERAYGSDSDDETDEEESVTEEDKESLELTTEQLEQTNGDEEEYIDHLYCVACNKSFKNESSMKNHESSKKHRDNIERIRKEMLEEEENQIEQSSDEDCDDSPHISINQNVDVDQPNVSDTNSCSESILDLPADVKSKKSRRKAKKHISELHISDNDDLITIDQNAPVAFDEPLSTTKSNKKSRRRSKLSNGSNPTSSSVLSSTIPPKDGAGASSDEDVIESWNNDRKPKKAAAKAAKKTKKPAILEIDDTVDIDHICVTCAAKFDSKNKLFLHLKKMNHGVYIEGKGQIVKLRETVEPQAAGRCKSRKK